MVQSQPYQTIKALDAKSTILDYKSPVYPALPNSNNNITIEILFDYDFSKGETKIMKSQAKKKHRIYRLHNIAKAGAA